MSQQQTVLYDAQGPRARRRTLIGTVVAVIALLGLAFVVYRRLDERGQFSMEEWGPLIDPGNDAFDAVWRLIGEGIVNTLKAATVAMVLSIVLGTLIAVARLSLGRVGRIPLIGLVELFRGIPVVVLVYIGVRVLPDVGVDLRGLPGGQVFWGLVIGLTVYNMVIFAEIVRAGVASLPKGQREAALATGLTSWQTMRIVLLPQAFRTMLPAIISQLIVVLKDTSLVTFIANFDELLSQGESIQRNLGNPIQTFFVIAVLYIAINYALGRLAQWIQARQARGGSAVKATARGDLAPVRDGA
ncbi:amino acid ABC transporter permease [Blastococcus sp. MG754426]|uniref:amino acid ABC transporter permease n=1 Tax=unclassified Blastococcus TaxID=2619396 RepID=UPI001EF085A4|nr:MULTISPECIES: amino acid ABC transporter permease [unclassified Blastococcus]MCF6507501.1 amino acid ABC transporter permease [Blastococcus sp. MG754426]MCF6512870.1 amino acid ABC transporter permease [Blastococcus sp. MG754427]MCF6733598.1 amino acid ABC transporter permease [Blastococcus sp. KM273129]